jgi:hypothetical protein
MPNKQLHRELVMWRLTTVSQERSPREVIFFDPISAGLSEEDIESEDDQKIILHNWPGTVIHELTKPEVTNSIAHYKIGAEYGLVP